MSDSLTVRLSVSRMVCPELYEAICDISPRHRAERLRTLATLGVVVSSSSSLSLSSPRAEPTDTPDAHTATRHSLLDQATAGL